MTDAEFRENVYWMRVTQRDYFKTRDAAWLVEAKRLEKIVDDELAGVKKLPMETVETEPPKARVDVLYERDRQDEKWGEQNHDPFTYLVILTEEVGEFAQAALHNRFGGEQSNRMREEAVQVAAVALAIVECLDRGRWAWPAAQQRREGEEHG
jgi:NTP pyrophosphatase (non-canonical NTP hydrolase)